MAITLNGTTGVTTTGLTSNGIDDNATSTAMTLDSSGNVGIGTASPSSQLEVSGSAGPLVQVKSTATGTPTAFVYSSTNGADFGSLTNHPTRFYVNNSERARLDQSGNLLVGMTSNGVTSTGIGLVPNAVSHMYSAGNGTNATLMLGRGSNDGNILSFNRSGTTVGSIGANSSAPYFATAVGSNLVGLKIQGGSAPRIVPTNGSGVSTDNYADLGVDAHRFKDLYLSGGVYLGGTGAGNKLTDYETGNWTPVGNHFHLSSVVHATYVKIGKTVTLQCWVNATNGSGSAIGAEITGLPFSSVTYSVGSVNISTANTAIPRLHCRIGQGSTVLYFLKNNDEVVPAQDIDAGHIIFSITYETNS